MLALYFSCVHSAEDAFSSRWHKHFWTSEWTLQIGLECPFWFELSPHGSLFPQIRMDTEETWKSTMLAFTYLKYTTTALRKILFPSEIRKSNLRQWTMLALICKKGLDIHRAEKIHLCISFVKTKSGELQFVFPSYLAWVNPIIGLHNFDIVFP